MNAHPFAAAMQEAISLAGNGRWKTVPNPTVGAVLVRDGAVVARGWHTAYGKAHAEIECLNDAKRNGVDPAQCTLVATLEPCAHRGQTSPCTEAILEAGLRHVVIGMNDSNPKAAGGARRLREAGVTVEEGVCKEACEALITDFLCWQRGLPFVILKLASTLDGRIAAHSGHSQWVTGDSSRAQVHALRAAIGLSGGAVLVGGNTLLADNPLLTARPENTDSSLRQPLAAALLSRLTGVNNLRLLQERPTETVIFATTAMGASPLAASLREQGVRVAGVPPWPPRAGLDLIIVLQTLFSLGCHYVLCEGGGKIGLSLLEAGLVGEFHMHIAPKVLGDGGAVPLFHGRAPLTMDEALSLKITDISMHGDDCHIILRPMIPPCAPKPLEEYR